MIDNKAEQAYREHLLECVSCRNGLCDQGYKLWAENEHRPACIADAEIGSQAESEQESGNEEKNLGVPSSELRPTSKLKAEPQVGDCWEFKLPHMKAKRVKTVGSISTQEFIVERATEYPWNHKTAMLPYVNWKRANKGRYTGITVRRLIEFGRRVSTKAERDAHLETLMANAKAKRQLAREQEG